MKREDKVFVAGGTGMVGSALIRKLFASGYTNLVSSRHSREPDSLISSLPVHWVQVDHTRQSDTEAFFDAERPDYVFLAAAKVGGILANATYKADFIYDNLAIATNIIKAANAFRTKKLLNLGSSCIYPRLAPQPMKEEYLLTGPLEPTNEPYAVAKIAAIKLCRYFNEQYRTNFISVMPTNLYGPGDGFNFETSHVLPAMIRRFHLAKLLQQEDDVALAEDLQRYPVGFGLDRKIARTDAKSRRSILEGLGITGEKVTLWGSGEPFREFLYVDELADAVLFLMENIDKQQTGEFVNVGTGVDICLKDAAALVKDMVGFDGEIAHDASKQDGMPRKLLDTTVINSLGWRSKISLGEGLKKTYSWYAAQAHP